MHQKVRSPQKNGTFAPAAKGKGHVQNHNSYFHK